MTVTTDVMATMDLSQGQFVKALRLDDNTLLVTAPFAQLKQVTRDPAELQAAGPSSRAGFDPDLEEERGLHELVQRTLSGNKKTNVPKYAEYIAATVGHQVVGVLPPVHLWTRTPLQTVPVGAQLYALIPTGERLIALDGETQLAAHYAVDHNENGRFTDVKQAHRSANVAVVLHHGIDTNAARQYFHDLNLLGVRPNTSLGLSMDTKDPIIQVVEAVERRTTLLAGRIDKASRQLPKRSTKYLTMTNLRQYTINVGMGMAGNSYGSRPVPTDELDLGDLEEVAVTAMQSLTEAFAEELRDRETYLFGTGAVLAAIGALVHERVYKQAPHDRRSALAAVVEDLRTVDWTKGEQWSGIAGDMTARGLSVKGTKERGYAVYNALTGRDAAAAARIRRSVPAMGVARWDGLTDQQDWDGPRATFAGSLG